MKDFEKTIGFIGGILIVVLLILIFKFLKYRKIMRLMNKSDIDELTIKGLIKDKTYNRFIVQRKYKNFKKFIYIFGFGVILLFLINLGVYYA